jgi:hypothetical protein
LHETIVDTVTPDFYRRSKAGEIFNNSLLKTTIEVDSTPIAYNQVLQTKDSHGCVTTASAIGTYPFSYILSSGMPILKANCSVDIDSLKAQAITNAWANVELSEANILASLGELGETVSSLVSIFTRSIKIFKAIKRLDIRSLKKEISPEELADRYMELRYALRPLVCDVINYISAISAMSNSHADRLTARGSKTDTDGYTSKIKMSSTDLRDIFVTISGQHQVSVRAGVLSKIDEVSALNIIGLDSVLEAAWELVPFSFVADWFFNIGKTLASWTPELGLTTLASWVTVKEIYFCHSSISSVCHHPPPYYSSEYSVSGSMTEVETILTRTPDPNRPIMPTFSVNLDWFKLLDLALILRNILK